MAKTYDVIIIGAGPAGLTAAKIAAEKGLSVVLVEVKKDITKITRTCSQQFGFSHIFGQSYTKPIRVEIESGKKAKLVFPDINLSVEYGGILRACYDWRKLSPNGNCVYIQKNTLWSFVFNKEILLKGLLEEAIRLGVTMRNETRGLSAKNTNDGVRVQIKNSKGETSYLKAKNAIVADGVNSRIVENLGLNKTRQTIGTTLRGFGYVMEGVECPYPPSSWISFAYPSINAYFGIWMGPMAEGTWQIGTTAKAPDSPREIINHFLSNSHFSSWFKNVKIAKKTGYSMTPRYPLAEPVVGNIVIIGDAAAPAETWIVGAMAGGYQAVNNILEDEMKKYIEWWKESFWFNSPDYFKDFARVPAISMLFKDNELNYLYGLIKDKVVVSIHEELINCAGQVRGEKPRIYKKLKQLQELSIEDSWKSES